MDILCGCLYEKEIKIIKNNITNLPPYDIF